MVTVADSIIPQIVTSFAEFEDIILNQRILRHNFAGLRAQQLGCPVSAVDLFLGCVGHESISNLYFKPCTNLVKAFPVLGEWCTRKDLINPKKRCQNNSPTGQYIN